MVPTEKLIQGKSGVRFFADVQGCYEPFRAMAEDALARDLALFSLGDLIDRGPDSPSCMRLACDLHDAGHFDMVPGNHDEKFVRYIQGRPVKLRRGFDVTVRQLSAAPDSKNLAMRFFDLVTDAATWRRFGDLYVVHGAFKPAMMGRDGPAVMTKLSSRELRNFALYGETNEDYEDDNGLPRRTFNWVENIPAGITVAVGHTVVSREEVTVRRNAAGGQVIHLDTGVDKEGGRLSWIDIPADMLTGKAPLQLLDYREVPDLAVAA